MSDCLTDKDLHRFHAQAMSDRSIERVRSHLEKCNDCTRRDQELAARHEALVDGARAQFSGSMDTLTAVDGSALDVEPPPDIHIEGYDILRELGRGGQGVVYQAMQLATKSKVAIKVLLHGAYASGAARQRFEREITMVAQMRHPHIISIYHSGTTDDGRLYYVMDYIRGLALTEYIRDNKLNLQDTLALFGKVCDAVQFAHQRGVIHRDLKPSNMRVDVKGNPKLLDFGLARWAAAPGETLSQAIVGTLPYMSPEQTKGNPDAIDTRSDIYALGVILYEMLTGHYPYPVTNNLAETISHIANTPPTPPSRGWTSDSGVTQRSDRRLRPGSCPIDDEIQTVVLKALSKEPERRYQSAGELARDLRRYLAGEVIDAKSDSAWYRLKVSVRRHRARYATAAGFVVLGAGFIANYAYSMDQKLKHQEQLTRQEKLERIIEVGMNQWGVGSYRNAIKKFDEALAIDPQSFRAVFQKAHCLRMLYLEVDDYRDPRTLQDAIALCAQARDILRSQTDESLLEKRPNVSNLLGTLYRQAGEYVQAEAYLREALEIKPTFFYASSNLAKLLAVQGRLEEALAAVETGLENVKAGGDDSEYRNDGIWLTRGTLRFHLGLPGAIDDLKQSIAIDGEDPDPRMMLARCYLHPDFLDADAALKQAENARLLTLNESEDGRILRLLAMACLHKGMLDEAEQYAEQAARHDDEEAYDLAIRAIVAARQDRRPAAELHLRSVETNWPDFMDSGIKVTDAREVLWVDTEEELKALEKEATEPLRSK